MLFTDVIGSSAPIFAIKKQKWWSHKKKKAIYGPVWGSFFVLHENDTVSDRYEK